jgi:hypothetical protein
VSYARILNSILLVSGLIGVVVGGAMLLTPVYFHATAGIVLGSDVNLLNEMRASGGALLASSGVIILGAIIAPIRLTAAIFATTLYLSYGLSRLLSMYIDGRPSDTLLAVAALELAIGLACATALASLRRAGSYRSRTD